MSWQLVVILFAVSAFEGIRRISPEALVLRCDPLGGWRVISPIRLWRDWHLVSVLPPLFLTIVVGRGIEPDARSSNGRAITPFGGSIEPILSLRLLGALEFLALVLGVPWGISRHSSAGLFTVLGYVLALSAAIALRSAAFLISEGQSRDVVFRRAMSLLSPFAAPLAAESMLSARLQNVSRLTTLSSLLGDDGFRALIRRSAYDIESNVPAIGESWLEELALSLPGLERTRILNSASDGCTPRERYCPRCGEKYSLETSFCTDCEGIALRRREIAS